MLFYCSNLSSLNLVSVETVFYMAFFYLFQFNVMAKNLKYLLSPIDSSVQGNRIFQSANTLAAHLRQANLYYLWFIQHGID